MTASASSTPEPLLDLQGLVAGIRWRSRTWVALGLLGLMAGALLALLMPPPPTAVARLLIVHETESSDSGQMETDVALLETRRIAAAALQQAGATERPEQFLDSYEAEGLTGNVLELTVTAASERDAVARARALAETFIADHVARAEAVANAEAQALLEQRSELETDLAQTGDPTRRTELSARIQDLGQRAQEAAVGAPSVAAGTRIVDGPRAISDSLLVAGVKNAVVGFVLGTGAGLALAAVASVVADRPVLRRDIATRLGASVIAQLPAPRRGPARLWRHSRGVAERERVAATLVRLVRDDSGPVSLLELGCPATVASLTLDIAEELADEHSVVVVDGLPGQQLHNRTGAQRPFRVVDAETSTVDPPEPAPQECRIGVGSVGPGTAWTDLGRLGSETLLVVRAGSAGTQWLHTVARQLADARISVIGVVVVHPDPRDRSDGTLWDGLHTALRGRAGAPPAVNPPAVDSPWVNGTAVAPPRGATAPLAVPERRFGRGPGTAPPAAGESEAVESIESEAVEVS